MIKKNNKKKKFGIIAISLAAISCIGVAFSTWVFGIVQNSDTDIISVDIDTVTSSSSIIEIDVSSTDNAICLAEFKNETNAGNGASVTGGKTPDFTIGLNGFRIIYSNDLEFVELTYTLSFAYKEALNNTENPPAFEVSVEKSDLEQSSTTDMFGRIAGKYDYIELGMPKVINTNNLLTYFELDNSMTGYTVYKFKGCADSTFSGTNESNKEFTDSYPDGNKPSNSTLNFTWGNYFEIKNNDSEIKSKKYLPSAFYQHYVDAVDSDQSLTTDTARTDRKLALLNKSTEETKAMYKLFSNNQLELKLTFNLETTEKPAGN